MDTPVLHDSALQPKLTQAAILNLFVITLADVYTLKSMLLLQLPIMVAQACSSELKMLIINSGTIINGQRIRLSLAITLLKKGTEPQEIKGNLNLENYLSGHITSKSFETDAILLTHLIVAESTEIAFLGLLSRLAVSLYPRAVGELINVSLKDARANKKTLETLFIKSLISAPIKNL